MFYSNQNLLDTHLNRVRYQVNNYSTNEITVDSYHANDTVEYAPDGSIYNVDMKNFFGADESTIWTNMYSGGGAGRYLNIHIPKQISTGPNELVLGGKDYADESSLIISYDRYQSLNKDSFTYSIDDNLDDIQYNIGYFTRGEGKGVARLFITIGGKAIYNGKPYKAKAFYTCSGDYAGLSIDSCDRIKLDLKPVEEDHLQTTAIYQLDDTTFAKSIAEHLESKGGISWDKEGDKLTFSCPYDYVIPEAVGKKMFKKRANEDMEFNKLDHNRLIKATKIYGGEYPSSGSLLKVILYANNDNDSAHQRFIEIDDLSNVDALEYANIDKTGQHVISFNCVKGYKDFDASYINAD